MRTSLLSVFTTILLVFPYAANAIIIYGDRTTFESALGVSVTDNYSSPGYSTGDISDLTTHDIHSDASMSAVLNETSYTTTGFTDWNIILNQSINPAYCAGCNGSYLLDFTSTSVGTALGVFGVGLDIVGTHNVFGTTAFVTFGDGSTENYNIPDLPVGTQFWGVTADELISSIHFGLVDGGINIDNTVQRMSHDNLTIGDKLSVPEPSTLALLSLGFIGIGAARKLKKH